MINWRDIQDRAAVFSHEWQDVESERSWSQSFWFNLFQIYGISARSLGLYEKLVKKLNGDIGRIDFFAPGKFIVEHKSAGEDLDSAFLQASDYMMGLAEIERPRHIIVSDFKRFKIYDLIDSSNDAEFTLEELGRNVARLSFLTESDVRVYKEEDPINVKAVRAVGRLYEVVRATNHFTPEEASRLLTRLVFCFFADDIGIFNANSMRRYLTENTNADGSDIGAHIAQIFQILDTDDGTGKENARPSTVHSALSDLPYVNGGLFGPTVKPIFGSREIRDQLITCMEFDWSRVSPEIFGSMFQSVMNEKERHDLGAHYTSELNILKVIDDLFLSEITSELEKARANEARLRALWSRIAEITLLDPACGCGNFLVVSYRELRKVENEIIARLHGRADKRGLKHAVDGHARLDLGATDLKNISRLSIERMYGIEIESFAVEVARLSLWIVDHMMNVELGLIFGKPLRKLPLINIPQIVQGNALRMDWTAVVSPKVLTHILGNPPYLGYKQQQADQKEDMATACGDIAGTGVLDYVAGWYIKAAKYIQNSGIKVGYVSTNSITQGEQVTALWRPMFDQFQIHIHFAHRTFKWTNEASGKAAVYCVIVGFSQLSPETRKLYEYDDVAAEPRVIAVSQINPYLVDAPTTFIDKRSRPISPDAPALIYGNEPREGGMLLLSSSERTKILLEFPALEKWVRRFVSADDFLNGGERYCFWLVGADPITLNNPVIKSRLAAVRAFREISKQQAAHAAANTPSLFVSIRQTEAPYLLIPIVSSENRKYIPVGYMSGDVITSNANFMLPQATPWHFGVLESEMHMTWTRAVCGRLKSDFRYSNTIVYNNFPWPQNVETNLMETVENLAQTILVIRGKHSNMTLAQLYDPNAMLPELARAHDALNTAVDRCYGKQFKNEPERLEFLFDLYRQLSKPETTQSSKTRKHKAKK